MSEKPPSHSEYTDEQLEPDFILTETTLFGTLRYGADWISSETYRNLFDRLHVRGGIMLDIGAGPVPIHDDSGSGVYMKALQGRGVKVVPIDRNLLAAHTWKLFRVPKEMRRSGENRAMPVQGDARALPIRDASVDGAISINLINSFERDAQASTRQVLAETHRALKPGGFFIISTFGYTMYLSGKGEMTVNNKIPLAEFITPAIAKELAQEVGFSVIEDIPLNQKAISNFRAERLAYYRQRQGLDMQALLIEDPIGLLLKK